MAGKAHFSATAKDRGHNPWSCQRRLAGSREQDIDRWDIVFAIPAGVTPGAGTAYAGFTCLQDRVRPQGVVIVTLVKSKRVAQEVGRHADRYCDLGEFNRPRSLNGKVGSPTVALVLIKRSSPLPAIEATADQYRVPNSKRLAADLHSHPACVALR